MQAAIGIQQVKRAWDMIHKRTENAEYLRALLKGCSRHRPARRTIRTGERVYFYFLIRLLPEILGTDMLNFAIALAAEGTYTLNYLSTTRWMIPQHLEPLFVDKIGYGGTKCPFECPWYEGEVSYYKGLCPKLKKPAMRSSGLPAFIPCWKNKTWTISLRQYVRLSSPSSRRKKKEYRSTTPPMKSGRACKAHRPEVNHDRFISLDWRR